MGKRLCYGVYGNVLKACSFASQEKLHEALIKPYVVERDGFRGYASQASLLFKCKHPVPKEARTNLAATEISEVKAHISKVVKQFIKADMLPAAVAAIWDIMKNDDDMHEDTPINCVDLNKRELCNALEINAVDFLTGMFIYVLTSPENTVGADFVRQVTDDFINDAATRFMENGIKIRVGSPSQATLNITDAVNTLTQSHKIQDADLGEMLAFLPTMNPMQQNANKNITITDSEGSYTGECSINEQTGQPEPHGYGKRIFTNGSFYVGEFIHGARCGRGTFTAANGATIQANWKNNNVHGDVMVTNQRGTYIGYEDGKRAYFEEIVLNTGYFFKGVLSDGLVDGTLFHPDGRCGRFYSSKDHGLQILSGDEELRREIERFPNLAVKQLIYEDGLVYRGEMRGETPHGYGRYIFPSEMILEAKNDMGIMDKRGKWIFPDNPFGLESVDCVLEDERWQGTCVINKNKADFIFSLEGYLKSLTITHPDGVWLELTPGIEKRKVRTVLSTGESFVGDPQWVFGLGYARGIHTDLEGIAWDGEWADGVKNGNFIITAPNGQVTTTAYKDDIPVGDCTMIMPNGEVYEFEWDGNKIANDYVKITFPDKSVYEGIFHVDSGLNGQGSLTLTDGSVYAGIWEDGCLNTEGVCIDLAKKWGWTDDTATKNRPD